MVKLVPVPKALPPVSAANQEIVPAEAVAPKVTVPVPTLDAGVVPVIEGVATGFTAKVCAVPLPQEVDGVTETVPEVPFVVTVTELVVPPAVFVQPEGNDQLYVVPVTLVTL